MWSTAALVAALLTAPAAGAPATVCTIDVPRLVELSGLVATGTGYVAINDGQDDPADTRVFYLDGRCRRVRSVAYPTPPRDPEDLAVAPDGTLWVADVGDNFDQPASERRETVALWRVPASGAPVIHRFRYPDGPHDAEALIFAGDGTPVIVTKEPLSPAGLYVPASPPRPGATVALRKAGEFRPSATGTPAFGGLVGQLLVTGGANAPDGSRVALRTYADAYEWDVPDGDVVKAITETTPRITALPDEPQGEAIAYSADGTALLTASDEAGPTQLRRYPTTKAPQPTAAAGPETPETRETTGRWVILAGAGLATAGLAVLGITAITTLKGRRRSRRPRPNR